MTQQPALDRVGLVVHPKRALDNALESVRRWAGDNQADVVQVPIDGQQRVVADPADAASCDVILALGGDGTTLAALHAAALAGKPVLGVACGSLGALTATTADRLDEALHAFGAGDWQPRRLPAIAVSPDGNTPVLAINDLVVVRKGASQIAIDVHIDGELYVRFAGDGIVVSTPLGSSAYTMAAGGPILAPGLDAIALTPLAPHGGCCPPLAIGTQTVVTVDVEYGHAGARIEFDGQVRDLQAATLELTWRPDQATLVAFDGAERLLTGLRRRRILMDSPRVLARDDREAAAAAASPG